MKHYSMPSTPEGPIRLNALIPDVMLCKCSDPDCKLPHLPGGRVAAACAVLDAHEKLRTAQMLSLDHAALLDAAQTLRRELVSLGLKKVLGI